MVCVAVNIMFFWSLLLVSSFPFFTHANVDLMTRGYDNEAIIRTFLIDGEVYDCIDIYKQPGIKHPFFINHTIQMEPTSYPEMTKHLEINGVDGESPVDVAKPWSLPESCPKGSVPMRRVQEMMGGHNSSNVDLHVRRRRRYFLKRNETNNYVEEKYDSTPHEHSVIQIQGERYLGARAYIAVCAPKIEMGLEFSVAQMWIHSMDAQISLETGWAVHPYMHRDPRTRFFTFHTINGYNTYCFNNECPGYIHTNPRIPPDTYLTPISFVNGPQHSVNVHVFQDTVTKHWWVSLQGSIMGYWLRDLVPSFDSGAEGVQFGGEVVNKKTNGKHTATEMGLGRFPSEGPGRAAFFKNVEVLPAKSPTGNYQPPAGNTVLLSEFPRCYNVQLGSSLTGDWGYHFFYGGPGRSTFCP